MMAAYSLWGIDSGNRILESDDETYVRTIIRELIELGWSPDNLSLGMPDDVTVLDGAELIDWMGRGTP